MSTCLMNYDSRNVLISSTQWASGAYLSKLLFGIISEWYLFRVRYGKSFHIFDRVNREADLDPLSKDSLMRFCFLQRYRNFPST